MPMEAGVEECNIGTEDKLKMMKRSKNLSTEMKRKYLDVLKEFFDVSIWGYKDLEFYNKNIIQHTIPVKEYQQPFKEKLQRTNPPAASSRKGGKKFV